MTGTLAQTIQGEAGSDPAAQFAVATTIYNRMQAGNFPGGNNPNAIVNAPLQYVGYSAQPNQSAQVLADAIQNGTLANYGTVGNAVNFQSGPTAAMNGLTSGANVGGNWFSNAFGPPTPGFIPPSFGASSIATGDPGNASSGIAGGSGAGSTGGLLATVAGPGAATPPGTGQQVSVGLQPSAVQDVQTWLDKISSGLWSSVWDSVSSAFLNIQNWFVRAFVIIVGLVILAIGLIKLSGHNVSDVIVAGGKMVAMA
jgi:hypothetical protein